MKIKKLTIAHISDLHRSPDNRISNAALLSSLLRDFDTCEAEGISKPNILIVSGDLVQGDSNATIFAQQYAEALDFLSKVANELFDGDRSRVILIPGNHDVSWEKSQESMGKIEEHELTEENGNLKRQIISQINKAGADIKWSWRDRSFYRVIDKEAYNNRFTCFSNMYKEFYEGKKTYSLDPDSQFEVFDYEEYGVIIVGFNSCFHNDHLNSAGSINPKCIGEAALKLRKFRRQGHLILSAWHHNTKGGPYERDYMDDSFLKSLISDGVKIGFHGHQHRNEVLRSESNIIDKEMMLILSAGSLCAGPSELPTGYNPQYNILELSRINNEKIRFKLFSREKTPDSSFDNPVWKAGVFGVSSTEYVTEIEHSLLSILDLGKAEQLLGGKRYRDAADILEQHDMEDPIVRSLLLECYQQLGENTTIIKRYDSPKNTTECIGLLYAGLEVGSAENVEKILNLTCIKEATDPSVTHLRDQLRGKKK